MNELSASISVLSVAILVAGYWIARAISKAKHTTNVHLTDWQVNLIDGPSPWPAYQPLTIQPSWTAQNGTSTNDRTVRP